MSIIVKEGVVYDRENPPAGLMQAVLFKAWDVGIQGSKFGEQHQIILVWELNCRYTKGDFKGKRMLVNKIYNAKFGTDKKPSNFRIDLEGWKGNKLNEFEVKSFDVETLYGRNCVLNIVLATRGENTYANVEESVENLPDGSKKIWPAVMPYTGTEKIVCECDKDWIPGRVKKLLETQIPQADPEMDAIANKAWGEAAKKEPAAIPTAEEVDLF
jgi:hypothetical protein